MHPIHLWTLPIPDSFPDEKREALYRLLSPAEQKHHDAMGSPGRRTEYLLSHTLARVKIAKVLGMKPQDLPLVFENNAKPSTIHDPRSTNNWHLSLSHTSSLVAVALAPFPVGVDVEPIGRTKHIDDVARKMFSPQEADD